MVTLYGNVDQVESSGLYTFRTYVHLVLNLVKVLTLNLGLRQSAR